MEVNKERGIRVCLSCEESPCRQDRQINNIMAMDIAMNDNDWTMWRLARSSAVTRNQTTDSEFSCNSESVVIRSSTLTMSWQEATSLAISSMTTMDVTRNDDDVLCYDWFEAHLRVTRKPQLTRYSWLTRCHPAGRPAWRTTESSLPLPSHGRPDALLVYETSHDRVCLRARVWLLVDCLIWLTALLCV